MQDPRQFLQDCLAATIARAAPDHVLAAHLPALPAAGRVIVVGAGKAAAASGARGRKPLYSSGGTEEKLALLRYLQRTPVYMVRLST